MAAADTFDPGSISSSVARDAIPALSSHGDVLHFAQTLANLTHRHVQVLERADPPPELTDLESEILAFREFRPHWQVHPHHLIVVAS